MDLLARTSRGAWTGFGTPALIAGWALVTLLFAWSVHAAGLFESLTPLSWVLGGFVGAALAAVIWRVAIAGHRELVKSRYDATLLARGGPIDPLARTFENKRIYLNEFALPSKPLIEDKTFIDCEIIGPANLILIEGNSIANHRFPLSDAVAIADGADPSNGYAFRNCHFSGCSFVRITLMATRTEYDVARNVDWLRWISIRPDLHSELVLQPGQVAHSLPYSEDRESSAVGWAQRTSS